MSPFEAGFPLQGMMEMEIEAGFPGIQIAGVDEVGRGCLAGPVVAACVVLPSDISVYRHPWLSRVTDSKLLRKQDREDLEVEILKWVSAYGIASASPLEIDSLNIHYATLLAMERALESLTHRPGYVLVDGKFVPKKLQGPGKALVKGDSRSLAIACASIIAKVYRDRHMCEMDAQYPGYQFSAHKGYPTEIHIEALDSLGITPIHRKSFAPVTERLKHKPKKQSV